MFLIKPKADIRWYDLIHIYLLESEMGDEMKLRIVFNVGNQFKEVDIDCDRNSTLASLYTDVIDHFGNEGKHPIDIKIGTWSNLMTSLLPLFYQLQYWNPIDIWPILGDDIIRKEHYDKNLVDLELQPNDKLEFVVGARTDAER